MKLPSFSLFGKKEKPQYFLALLLRDEKVNAVIFEEFLGKIRVIGEQEEEFKDTIEAASLEEWLEVLDKAISQAESSLPENIETQKTIFGVKEDWIEGKQIKKDYLTRLKRVSDELGLTPIGFLVIAEAIAHFLGKEEGVPVSAILVELGKQKIAVSLLRAGRVIETKRTRVEDSIAQTTDRILHHFTYHEVLPSRIILFNSKNDEDLSQELIGHSWSKSLPFLHVPQITTLPAGFDAKSIIFGAASEMGFEVLGDVGIEQKQKQEQEKKEIEETQETASNAADAEGTETEAEVQLEEKEEVKKDEQEGKNFGFVIGKDVSKDSAGGPIQKAMVPIQSPPINQPEVLLRQKTISPNFAKITSLILQKTSRIRTIGIPRFSLPLRNKKAILIPPLVILFFIGLLMLYLTVSKASITLHVTPTIIEKNQEVIFSTSTQTDFAKNLIAAESLVVSENGSLSTPATGTKEIGEKAKGTVTIFNNSLEAKTFQKDSVIKSTNDLEFTLDESVTIASASGDASSPSPTSKKVNVSAKEIGKEYNLPSGTKFTIGAFPITTVVAKNDSAFSGGNKKEVTAVSKEDLQKLTSELPKSLEKQVKEKMGKEVDNEKEILPDFANITLTKKEFDKDAFEEAKSVKLTATVSYQTISYKKSDLEAFAKNRISETASDMTLSNDVILEIKNVKQKNKDEITAIVYTKATLLPILDHKKLSEITAGKSFEDAHSLLIKLPKITSVDILLSPHISFLPSMLPKRAQNISFEVILND